MDSLLKHFPAILNLNGVRRDVDSWRAVVLMVLQLTYNSLFFFPFTEVSYPLCLPYSLTTVL